MRLIALKEFSHSVGVICVGQEFEVSSVYGHSLIASEMARPKDLTLPQTIRHAGRWADAAVVILASGPSLTAEDVETVRAWRAEITPELRRVIVINTTFEIALWADVLYAADLAWWQTYHEVSQNEFKGERWTQQPLAAKTYGLKFIECERRPGLSLIPGVIHNGGNSGYQSIGLAASFGAKKIILLGFDMQKTNGESHHHGNHPKGLRQASPFVNWLRSFKQFAFELKAAGVRVVNASRVSAIQDFDKVELSKALDFHGQANN